MSTSFCKGKQVVTRYELHPYQDEAVDFILSRENSGLFIDMGLGKTAIILHALLELPKPVLLIGPIRVIETVWRQEAAIWASTRGLTFSLVRGTPKVRQEALDRKADIYLVNPELLLEALENGPSYHVLVIDESTLFKNPSTSRFKTLRKYLRRFSHRIISTGTPTPNSLLDLWSQIFVVDLGDRFGKAFGRFQQTYFYTTDFQGYKWAPHTWARDKIIGLVSDVVFRVSSKDVFAPRAMVRNIVHTPLPPAAQKHYDQMEAHAFTELSENESLTAATAAVVMMKLRQVASGFVYDDDGKSVQIHSEKIKATQSILDETGSPVILVYQFQHELEAIKKAFPQGVVFESKHQAAWDAGELPLVFLHPQSGGHGLNMQYGGHTMVVFSGSFSSEQMGQIMGRIDRQGQIFPVVFHFLVAPGTVDELLMKVLDQKWDDQSAVLSLIKEYANAKTSRS